MPEIERKTQKRITEEDLCFDVKLKVGRRDNKPLMVVVFRESSNYSPAKHEWVPKINELKFLTQALNGISSSAAAE